MGLEEADALPDDAGRLVAGKGDGVEVDVHGGGIVIFFLWIEGGGEDWNCWFVILLAEKLVMSSEREVGSFVSGAEGNWRSRCVLLG